MANKWAGPVTEDASVADLLAFDALPEAMQMMAERAVRHRLAEAGESVDRVAELEEEIEEVETENEKLRDALQEIADGNVRAEDVETFAKGALAA